ncbi:MAG: hypothetical protein HC838_10955, partial [Spirulinaceae cyanobacterium RM2_2_10]|nr:hypothetical protein [Spirulinaceae cyanobacterium RM2_2_10]
MATTTTSDDDDDGPGLFDSDSEDDTKPAVTPKAKPMSKRQRMEALQAKKRQEMRAVSTVPSEDSDRKQATAGDEDEDSYNSAEYVRTKEDLDFIDTEGDDADAVAELYAEQNFDDERGEAIEEPSKKKKINGAGTSTYRGKSERAQLE